MVGNICGRRGGEEGEVTSEEGGEWWTEEEAEAFARGEDVLSPRFGVTS